MMEFWGRARELDRLRGELELVRTVGRGRMLAMRGRRQTGKSRLLSEFVEDAGVPYLFFTAIKNAGPTIQVEQAMQDLATSTTPLPRWQEAFAAPATSWADLFARLPAALGDGPAVIVLDEFPWATQTDDTLEGVLQRSWDRILETQPVLLVLVGSDISMMERLTAHDRPLYGRAAEMVLPALSPAETATAFPGRAATEIFDLCIASGGYPRLVSAARQFETATKFVQEQLRDDQSPLSVTGLRVLDAEFRDQAGAQRVLEAIGSVEVGHATFSTAAARLSDDDKSAGTTVSRALSILVNDMRLVAIDMPVGAKPTSRLRRYRIVDPYLRFWFRYCAPHLDDMARGRADLAINHFKRDFSSWRGKTMEPIVHDGLRRLAAVDSRLIGVESVGGWWDRRNQHEYDVVGADRTGKVLAVGTIKWKHRHEVTAADMAAAATARAVVPGASGAKLVAVCPGGVKDGVDVDVVVDAAQLLEAFSP